MNIELMLGLLMFGVAGGALWCSGEAWADRRCYMGDGRQAYLVAAGIWALIALLLFVAGGSILGFEIAVCQ